MSDLFSNYKNRGDDRSYNAALSAVHKAWYKGQAFASIASIEAFLSDIQLDPKCARGVWYSNEHIKWSEKRVLPSA